MSDLKKNVSLLKNVLENMDHPEKLNKHPWANTPMVCEEFHKNPNWKALSPGDRLVRTIVNLFVKMMPDNEPRNGLRLDNQWGEFGIIAAQYFAPFLFDYPHPSTLREAWQQIDKAILLFARKYQHEVKEEDVGQYILIGNEPEVAPNSTISDWHRKGIEKFAQFLDEYEQHLRMKTKISSKQGKILWLQQHLQKIILPQVVRVWVNRIFLLIIIGFLIFGVWESIVLYQKVQLIADKTKEIIVFADALSNTTKLDIAQFQNAAQHIAEVRSDLGLIKKDYSSLIKIAPYLEWLPKYGGDISQAPLLLEMAIQMSTAGDELCQVILPILPSFIDEENNTNLLNIISEFETADTQLVTAQIAIANMQVLRQEINTDKLSPDLFSLITAQIDPLLHIFETSFPITDVLKMAQLAPRLLGSAGNGLQTYMILVQNEDELRPTGGFLTAVGLLQVENNEIKSITFESSDLVDDLSKPYPKAPWQLDDYMMSEILLFRDSNWFTDFPTTVEWAKFLYAYTRSKEIDGVITVDQHVIQELLKIVGPLNVTTTSEPITAENVLQYMRTAKEPTPPKGISRNEWDRKQFIGYLADPLIDKLLTLDSHSLQSLSSLMVQLLDEKHILLQFNDPEMSTLISSRGWDGSVRADEFGDFLMVVDSNIGFNKTSAMMDTYVDYSVNLSNLNLPIGHLEILQKNNSLQNENEQTECIQFGGSTGKLTLSEREYILNDCYWSYLRVYTPVNVELITSIPHEIPEKWTLRESPIPARIDLLDEKIPGIQAFGTILVVPKDSELKTNFTYSLPYIILKHDRNNNSYIYHLKIQKQPGTNAIPVDFHLKLPEQVEIISVPEGLYYSQGEWVLKSKLEQDLTINIEFQYRD